MDQPSCSGYTLAHKVNLMTSTRTTSGLAILLALAPVMFLTQPANGANTPASAPPTAAQTSASRRAKAEPPPQSVEVYNGDSIQTEELNAPQHGTAVPSHTDHSSAGTSVEIINGSEKSTAILNDQQSTGPAPAKTLHKRGAKSLRESSEGTDPPVTTVEIINGSEREFRTLNDTSYETARQGSAHRNTQPVVVAIVSSDTRRVGINRRPVVIGIESAGPDDLKASPIANGSESTAKSNQKSDLVVIGIAPRLKRPPYQP